MLLPHWVSGGFGISPQFHPLSHVPTLFSTFFAHLYCMFSDFCRTWLYVCMGCSDLKIQQTHRNTGGHFMYFHLGRRQIGQDGALYKYRLLPISNTMLLRPNFVKRVCESGIVIHFVGFPILHACAVLLFFRQVEMNT